MAQLFHPFVNTVVRGLLVLGALGLVGVLVAYAALNRSSLVTGQGVPVVEQPVPFSHRHHVGEVGLDCRYCHRTVETEAAAGMPDTYTCMSCHGRILPTAPMLAPVRRSYLQDRPLRWRRVNRLADFVHFDHGIHVRKGVGCSSCHGRIDRMPLTARAASLRMEWCLDCHRHPERALRPPDRVFDAAWTPPPDQEARGRALARDYGVRVGRLTDCALCHY